MYVAAAHNSRCAAHVANKARNVHAQLPQETCTFYKCVGLFLWAKHLSLSRPPSLPLTYLGVQECQTLVDIFDFMYTHPSAVRLAQFLRRYYLEQLEQLDAIG